MTSHEYTPREALDLLVRKLEQLDRDYLDLAGEVRAAIDAGKEVDAEERPSLQRGKGRKPKKAVPLSEEEALQAALSVFRAYFVEQPLFVSSALSDARFATLGEPREKEILNPSQPGLVGAANQDTEKIIVFDLRTETQVTAIEKEGYVLQRTDPVSLTSQRENLDRLRELLTFQEN